MNKWITGTAELATAVSAFDEERFEDAIKICSERISRGENDVAAALLLRAMCFAAIDRPDDAQYDHGRGVVMLGGITSRDRFELAEEAMDYHLPNSYCAVTLEQAGGQLEHSSHDPLRAASAWNKAGICYYRSGQLSKEIECFEHAQSLLIGDDGNPLDLTVESDDQHSMSAVPLLALVRSNLAESFNRSGRTEESLVLYEQAASGFQSVLENDSLFDLEHYALCQRSLSELYRAAGDNVRASACLTRAIDSLSAREDDCPAYMLLQLSGCYNARGTLRYQMGDYSGEISDCTEALRLRNSLPSEFADSSAMATIYFNRAEAYGELDNVEKEIRDYESGIAILDTRDDDELRVMLCIRQFGLGKIYDELDDQVNAQARYLLAADGFAQLREHEYSHSDCTVEQLSEMEALCRFNLGLCYCAAEEKSYYGGVTEHRKAIELLSPLPLTPDRADRLATLYTSLGELYEMFDEYDKARESFLESEHYRTITVLDELAAERLGDLPYDDSHDSISDCRADDSEDIEDENQIWGNASDDTPKA